MRQGVVIYNDWAPLLKRLPDALRGKVFTAVLDYSETGVRTETGDPAADMLLAVMYQRMESDLRKYEEKAQSISDARREAGVKGAEKRWQKMANDGKNSKCHLPMANDGKNSYNTNSNTNTNIREKSTLTCAKKESAAIAATPVPKTRHDRFLQWLADNCPYIAGHYKLPSTELLDKLIAKYGAEQVAEQCLNIENRTDLRKRYTNLYQTLNNWCKRETELNQKYGKDRKYNQEGKAERAEGVAQLLQRLADEDDQRAASASLQPHSVA